MPLPLSAFIAYFFVNNAVCNVIDNNIPSLPLSKITAKSSIKHAAGCASPPCRWGDCASSGAPCRWGDRFAYVGVDNILLLPLSKVVVQNLFVLPVGRLRVERRGSLMSSVTIFCFCPYQHLLYISAFTARFAYVGCCILPLPLSKIIVQNLFVFLPVRRPVCLCWSRQYSAFAPVSIYCIFFVYGVVCNVIDNNILLLPLSAFIVYLCIYGVVCYVAKPDKSGKTFSKTEDAQKSTKGNKSRQNARKNGKNIQKGRKWRRITTKTCKNCQKANEPLKHRQNSTKTDKTSQNNRKTFPNRQKENKPLKSRQKSIAPSALSQNGRGNSYGAKGKKKNGFRRLLKGLPTVLWKLSADCPS